jgi:hypothetical protein
VGRHRLLGGAEEVYPATRGNGSPAHRGSGIQKAASFHGADNLAITNQTNGDYPVMQ